MSFPFYIGILNNPDTTTQPVDSSIGLEEGGYTGTLVQLISSDYSPVGDWRLREDLLDDSVYEIALTGISNPLIQGNYIYLNGINYLEGVDSLLYDGTNKFTVLGSFKKDNNEIIAPYETIVSKAGTPIDDAFAVILDQDSRKLALFVSTDGHSSIEAGIIDLQLDDITQYITFCFTFDSGDIKGYINSVQQNIIRWK